MNSLPDDLGPRLRDSVNRGAAPELSTELVAGAADRTAPHLTNPRRTVQVAGGATVVVAAVAIAALVIVPGLSQAPLFTAAAASASTGTSAGAAVPATHGLYRIWADYVYEAGPNLSTSGGNGDVYQLSLSGSGSDRASALGADFGLTNQAVTTDNSDQAKPEFTIGSADGSAPEIVLTWSGTGDWWYSDPAENPAVVCAPIDGSGGSSGSAGSSSSSSTGSSGGSSVGSSAGDSSGGGVTTSLDCTGDNQPVGPDNAPTGADARSQAQAIFAETGLSVSTDDIQLTSDSTQTTATANLEVGGVKTALQWGVTWSSTGKVSSAYGSSVAVHDRGSYGTISAADAVTRLSDSRWAGTAGPPYSGGIRPFAFAGAGTNKSTSVGSAPVPDAIATPVPAPQPTGAPTPLPAPVPTVQPMPLPTAVPTGAPTDTPTGTPSPEPVPTAPPIIKVSITKADSTLLLMWDSKGGAWLVPGYAMQIENGWWDAVVSLVPGVIDLPPIPTVEPDEDAPGVAAPGAAQP